MKMLLRSLVLGWSAMLYLSVRDTELLDIRMTEVVPGIEEALRRYGRARAVVVPRVRVVHPPLTR